MKALQRIIIDSPVEYFGEQLLSSARQADWESTWEGIFTGDLHVYRLELARTAASPAAFCCWFLHGFPWFSLPHNPFLITGLLVSAHLLRSAGGDLLAHAWGLSLGDLFALEGLQHLKHLCWQSTSIHIFKLVKSCQIRMFFCCLNPNFSRWNTYQSACNAQECQCAICLGVHRLQLPLQDTVMRRVSCSRKWGYDWWWNQENVGFIWILMEFYGF